MTDTKSIVDQFVYDPETGNLHYGNNHKFPGRLAGSKLYQIKTRYPAAIRVQFERKFYSAHRIIWEMHYGPIPDGMVIDHKDCNPFNNKLENLRLATKSQNRCNSRTTNSFGLKGVYRNKKSYQSLIRVSGKLINLGVHKCPTAAHLAYCRAALLYHGQFSRT